jgi:hypothetical protein
VRGTVVFMVIAETGCTDREKSPEGRYGWRDVGSSWLAPWVATRSGAMRDIENARAVGLGAWAGVLEHFRCMIAISRCKERPPRWGLLTAKKDSRNK